MPPGSVKNFVSLHFINGIHSDEHDGMKKRPVTRTSKKRRITNLFLVVSTIRLLSAQIGLSCIYSTWPRHH
jgi:hypothetical protein